MDLTGFSINGQGELHISPSSTSSKEDFDFFVGKWQLRNKKLQQRLANCTEWTEFDSTQECYKILHGLGNIDNFIAEFDGSPFEGMTVRLFNPATKLWSIYWADSNLGVLDRPVVGSFENKIGHFYSKEVHQGQEVLAVFRWDARDAENPVWSQALSADQGKTWEWNWYMYMRKMKL